jgi:hypothetical protein
MRVSEIPSGVQERLDGVHEGIHAACVVCGVRNPRGLRVLFHVLADGSVETLFPSPKDLCRGHLERAGIAVVGCSGSRWP